MSATLYFYLKNNGFDCGLTFDPPYNKDLLATDE
jgi:hypothetical protein